MVGFRVAAVGLWIGSLALIVGARTGANVIVFPLSDPSDPVVIANAEFKADDPSRLAMVLTLQNNMALSVATDRIWIMRARFFTPDEMKRRGNNTLYNCATSSRASFDEPTKLLLPGTQVLVTLMIPATCELDLAHEHFFVEVSRITAEARSLEPIIWMREPEDAGRLLAAMMSRVE
jgi:hypothetical protein